MILEVYDKVTLERLDLIRTYSFVEYTDYFNDIGEFTIKIPINEPSFKYLKIKGNYILFDKTVMGVVKYVYKQSLENTTITIKGFLINSILSYRSFLKTTNYSGKFFEVQRQMVIDLFINPTDVKRKINFIELSNTYPESDTISYQNTGDKLSDVLTEMNEPFNYGYKLVPNIIKYNPLSDNPTNIGSFVFNQYISNDRTMYNESGNNPVVFSASLNNLSDLSFEDDGTEYCSVAYVAGEGTGQEREGILVGKDLNVSGIDRIELFVDARDIQKENNDGTEMSQSEYEELLTLRGNEYLEQNTQFISLDGTVITNGNNSFIYGTDYYNGDFVTIMDEQLGINVDLQIIGIRKSLTTDKEIIDLLFGKEKASIYKMVKKNSGGVK